MVKQLVASFFMWAYAVFYGMMVLLSMIKGVITEGPSKFFKKTKRERPSSLQDPQYGTHGFLNLEDIKIHYVSKGPEDRPLMLFLHGFPEFWFSWRKQIVEFSKDYRCVAIDMRGYGESSKPVGIDKYQTTFLLKDVKQVIEALGCKSCHLVAHDWGGAVAWEFARLFPEYVDKLIVMNCPSGPIFKKVIQTSKQFKMSWYMFFFQLPYLPEILIGSKDLDMFNNLFKNKNMGSDVDKSLAEDIEAYKYTFSQPGAISPPLNYYRAAFRLGRKPYDMNYSMPVLVIWGTDDMALCDEIPDEIEKAAPSITVKRIEKCGHFVQTTAPQDVNKIMREWLSSPQSERE